LSSASSACAISSLIFDSGTPSTFSAVVGELLAVPLRIRHARYERRRPAQLLQLRAQSLPRRAMLSVILGGESAEIEKNLHSVKERLQACAAVPEPIAQYSEHDALNVGAKVRSSFTNEIGHDKGGTWMADGTHAADPLDPAAEQIASNAAKSPQRGYPDFQVEAFLLPCHPPRQGRRNFPQLLQRPKLSESRTERGEGQDPPHLKDHALKNSDATRH